MASNDQDSDGIIGSSTAGEYGVNDATSEAIFDVHSFLKEMDESLDKDVDHMKQFKKMVESLKEDQINLHTNDFTSETALHIAVRRGLVQATTILLTAEASVAEEDYMQCQPLHRACEIGNGPIVESLLKMGADIEALDCDKWTPLRWSASGGHMQVVELLLRSNANILAADDDGHTPFHVAADNGHTEMIEKFLQKNGSIL
ncbi:ankyrin repeat-containing domain protein, partial [Hypoxylon sp. FL0890]